MNPDPDFHPLAAAWLEGAAAPPEQKLLAEILHSPDLMREYAELCLTEALLVQSRSSAAQRRAALGRIVEGKPWLRRASDFWKHRLVRLGAAAAFVGLLSWWFWPKAAVGETAVKRKPSIPATAATPRSGNSSAVTADEAPLPPAADGLEQRLRRDYISGFKTSAPLTQAATALARALHPGSEVSLTVDVRSEGDAPVHLALRPSLPAWTLLQMMALQSGTEFHLSGHSLVFKAAKKPVPLEGTLARTSELTPLRTLYGIMEKDSHAEELNTLTERHMAALGGRIGFKEASETSAGFSGTPRDVRALELALNSVQNPPVMVKLTVKLVELAPGVVPGEDIVPGAAGPGLDGIFTDEQFQAMMRNLAGIKGVNLQTISSVLTRPNHEVKVQSTPGRPGIVALLVASPDEEGSCSLHCEMGWGVGLPGEQVRDASGLVNTQVLLFSGQTLGLSGFRGQDGSQILAYVTATLIQPDGTPLPPLDKAPDSPATSADSAPAESAPSAGAGLPYGIPVAGKQGMVYSPYAPEKGMIDVEGLKRGTRVECPYTSKHFRVP